jgi:selenocysteine lyase/cysteine desulfurase
VRASLVHYNTAGEIAQFGASLREVLAELRSRS